MRVAEFLVPSNRDRLLFGVRAGASPLGVEFHDDYLYIAMLEDETAPKLDMQFFVVRGGERFDAPPVWRHCGSKIVHGTWIHVFQEITQ